jgi:hypothetical protein
VIALYLPRKLLEPELYVKIMRVFIFGYFSTVAVPRLCSNLLLPSQNVSVLSGGKRSFLCKTVSL